MTTKIDVRKALYASPYSPTWYLKGVPCKDEITSSGSAIPSYTVYNSVQKTAVGEDIPNHEYLIANHLDATGEYTLTNIRSVYSDAYAYILMSAMCRGNRVHVSTCTYKGSYQTAGMAVGEPDWTSLQAHADNQAASQLLNEAGSARSAMLVTLGEMRETIRMLRDPVNSLLALVRSYYSKASDKDLKILRRTFPKKARKKLNDLYLEFTYGWKPLNADVHKLLGSVKQFTLDPIYANIEGHGYAEDAWSTGETSVRLGAPSGPYRPYYLWHDVTRHKAETHVRAQVKCVSSVDAPLDAALYYTGFTLPDVLPAVWELLPYSFLVDYFNNIGDVINASCTGYGDVNWASTGRKQRASRSRHFRYDPVATANYPGYTPWLEDAGFFSEPHLYERFRFTRTGGLVYPTLEATLPGGDSFGMKRYLNVISLLYASYLRR